MMKIAIMQPYFMPYIGYFQLIKAVDRFVFYDDVNYIKQGWINRNNILIQEKASLFTIPLEKASSFSKINEVMLHPILFLNWKTKFLRSIEQSYKKAPFFEEVFSLVNTIVNKDIVSIGVLAKESVIEVARYLELNTEFVYSSSCYQNDNLSGKERVLAICKDEKASVYINPIGGQELYDKTEFLEKEIDLFFIKSNKIEYKQFKEEFIPWLSIIDILMFNSKDSIHKMLDQYSLI